MQIFLVFLCFFAFNTLDFEDFHNKNHRHYFNIVPLICSILVNPNLIFFDEKDNFELAIILPKSVFSRIFCVKVDKTYFICSCKNSVDF